MRYIEFGKDKEKVSELIIGLMRISEMTTEAVAELIHTGLEEGINFLDLADIYGGGKSEEIVGKVFTENPGLREKVFLQSKCGIRCDPDFTYFDFSKDYILEAVDGMLARLRTDHLDSLLLHRPDALMEPDEIAEAFDRLYESGKVRNFGVSNMTPMMMEMLSKEVTFPICANQIQLSCAVTQVFDAGFHMDMQCDRGIMRDGGGVLEYCRMKKIPQTSGRCPDTEWMPSSAYTGTFPRKSSAPSPACRPVLRKPFYLRLQIRYSSPVLELYCHKNPAADNP